MTRPDNIFSRSHRLVLSSFFFALALFIGLLGIAIFIAARTQENELQEAEATMISKSDLAFISVQEKLRAHMRGLDTIQDLFNAGEIGNDARFDIAATVAKKTAGHFAAINFIDTDRRIVRVWPLEGNRAALGRVLSANPDLQALLDRAETTGLPQVSEELNLFQGGRGVASYFPVTRDGRHAGFINGVFRVSDLEGIIGDQTQQDLSSRLLVGRLAQGAAAMAPSGSYRTYTIQLHNQSFMFETRWTAASGMLPETRTELYWGILVALLSSVLVFVLQVAMRRESRHAALLSGVLQTAPTAVISMDAARKIAIVNPAAEKMFQRSAAELIGQDIDILIPPQARERHRQHVEEYATNEENVRIMGDWRTVHGLRADGEKFPVLVSLGKSYLGGGLIFTAVLRDMTDEAKAHDRMANLLVEYQKQKELADAANRAKTMFLASMSHELRTPLNAIIGFSDILQMQMFGPIGNERYSDYIGDISRSGRHLLSLINDILDHAKMETGAYRFEIGNVDLAAVIQESVRMVEPLIRAKGLTLSTGSLPQAAPVQADERATRQVLSNLLSNAIKFTEAGGSVTVAVSTASDGSSHTIAVEDTGRGIPAEDLERIGKPFVQVGDPYQAEVKGTGLGLAICRRLVEGMSGSLQIDSQYGVGTRVVVSLPGVKRL